MKKLSTDVQIYLGVILFRVGVEEDIPAISRIYEAAVETSSRLDHSVCGRLISSRDLFVAERDSAVIGFGALDLSSAEPLKWLYVTPEQQGHGTGAQLLDILETRAWEFGLQSLRVHAAPDAVQFYLKHGYHRVDYEQTSSHDHAGVELVKHRH